MTGRATDDRARGNLASRRVAAAAGLADSARNNVFRHHEGRGNFASRSLPRTQYIFSLILVLLFMIGCQGRPKDDPPIHINPNMDNQPKYLPQAESDFWPNDAADRQPVEGTIARGNLRLDTEFYEGKDSATGELVTENPVEITASSLARGQERFNIYCAVCHGQDGFGRGIMIQRGYTPPPSFHEPPVSEYSDGHIYDVIVNGIRNMPGYENQIPVEDRWKIVQYVRALQRSQAADVEDVPVEYRDKLD